MKPLLVSQKVFALFRVYKTDELPSSREKLHGIIFVLINAVICAICYPADFGYMGKYLLTDFEEALYPVFQLAGAIIMTYALIDIQLSRRQIASVFESLTKIYDKCKSFYGFEESSMKTSSSQFDMSRRCQFNERISF